MSDTPLKLYIDGGLHITKPKQRIKDIEDTIGEVDVVFVESPRANGPSWRTVAANFLTMPLLVATMYLWVAILTIWRTVIGLDDGQIVTHFSDTHGAKVVPTDRNVHVLLSESRHVWFLGHGIVVLLALLAVPTFVNTAVASTVPNVWIVTLFLLTGVGLFALFLAGTLPSRDLQIAHDIEHYAANHDDSTACLITGSHHAPGVRTILKDSDNVRVYEKD